MLKDLTFLMKNILLIMIVLEGRRERILLWENHPAIYVSGDFRERFNIFACISANPNKSTPIAYHIEKTMAQQLVLSSLYVQ